MSSLLFFCPQSLTSKRWDFYFPKKICHGCCRNSACSFASLQLQPWISMKHCRWYLTYNWPNITFSISAISTLTQHPSKVYLGAAMQLLCYISWTLDYRIWYSIVSNFRLCTLTDCDWTSSLDDRQNILTNTFYFGSWVIT